ncbi:unnamed protein product, partial [Rotaria sordida]
CSNTTIKFLDLGLCQNETGLVLSYKILASEAHSHSEALKLLQIFIENDYQKMYGQMLNVIRSDIFHE